MLDPRIPMDDYERLMHEFRSLRELVENALSPSGTQRYTAVSKLQALVESLQQQLDEYISTQAYTKAQVDAKVANPGDIAPGNVTASGAMSAGGNVSANGNVSAGGSVTGASGRFNGGLASTDVYSRLVTGGGSYRATWTHQDGTLGYAPSSRRFKRDVEPLSVDFDALRQLRAVTFRYIDAVDNLGDDAAVEVGLIAEEVAALGLDYLVDYDDEGLPFGVRYERLAVALIPRLLDQERRLDALEQAVRDLAT